MAGHRVHKPGKRCLSIYAFARAGEGGHGEREGVTGSGADLPVPELRVYGERDIVPVEAVPGGEREPRQVLEPIPFHNQFAQLSNVTNQQRTGLFHRDFHTTQGLSTRAPRFRLTVSQLILDIYKFLKNKTNKQKKTKIKHKTKKSRAIKYNS